MNISSVVVKTTPEQMQPLLERLTAAGLCDVHFHDAEGRIVVTIEGESIDEEMGKLKLIQRMPQVISAALAYAYSEEEPVLTRERIDVGKVSVPDSLKE